MRRILPIALWITLIPAAELGATGPRSVTSGGLPVKWSSMPVTVHLEADLDVRGKDVTPLVEEALNAWVNLDESDVTITSGSLGVAVDEGNVCDYLVDSAACPGGPTDDGTNPLVIDEDGAITAEFFGLAGRFTTLGFAAIISSNMTSGAAVKGEAVFNAACLTGVEVTPGCTVAGLSFSDDDFTSFIVHELGHFLGLDHSQTNLTEAIDDLNGDGTVDSDDSLITTMFPTFIPGNGANFKTPDRDDQVGLAQLYPSSSFSANTWTLAGTVYDEDGRTELQCANLVARNTADPRVDAISALSGDFSDGSAEDGAYEIPGLAPGATYSLDVEPIGDGFTGSSGYTPCRGSNGESAPPDFAAFTAASTFSGTAGETKTVNCTIGSGCSEATGGSGGGCSLMP